MHFFVLSLAFYGVGPIMCVTTCDSDGVVGPLRDEKENKPKNIFLCIICAYIQNKYIRAHVQMTWS